jgi:hypothetical protein
MADDNNNVSSELESALAEINALEKEIALADYELRNVPFSLLIFAQAPGPSN